MAASKPFRLARLDLSHDGIAWRRRDSMRNLDVDSLAKLADTTAGTVRIYSRDDLLLRLSAQFDSRDSEAAFAEEFRAMEQEMTDALLCVSPLGGKDFLITPHRRPGFFVVAKWATA